MYASIYTFKEKYINLNVDFFKQNIYLQNHSFKLKTCCFTYMVSKKLEIDY